MILNFDSFLLYKKADPSQMSRSEDEIIAWTWNTFIESKGSDPIVLLRMPMTKVGQINYELPFMSF